MNFHVVHEFGVVREDNVTNIALLWNQFLGCFFFSMSNQMTLQRKMIRNRTKSISEKRLLDYLEHAGHFVPFSTNVADV